MSRCEGYYRVENRRCDREAVAVTRTPEGDFVVCEYHRRLGGPLTRWVGETGRRTTGRLRLIAAA